MEPKDDILWHLAKKRAGFKKHLISYVIVNSFLWTVWFASGREYDQNDYLPWPVWVMLWWGVGLAFNYVNAYVVNTKDSIEKEYQKLKNQQS